MTNDTQISSDNRSFRRRSGRRHVFHLEPTATFHLGRFGLCI